MKKPNNMLHPRYSTRAAAVAAIDCGYSESIGGDYPATWRSATRSIEQVGESHWWAVQEVYSVRWCQEEVWIGPSLCLMHVYQDGGEWIVKRWEPSAKLTRYDCPLRMIGSQIAANGAWKAKVRKWHQQEMPAVKS